MRSAAGAGDLAELDAPVRLAGDEAEGFARDGHACLRGLLSPAVVAGLAPAVQQAAAARTGAVVPLDERDTYGRAFLQAANVWRLDDDVRRLVCSRRLASAAAALLGVDGVRLYHDQVLTKEAGGGITPWHQDQRYWPLETDATVTVWLPLGPVAAEVGSMTFASGSHLLGDLRGPVISDESEAAFAAAVRERRLELASYGALELGDATFHAGWTLHRAGANPTAGDRPVLTVIYFADGTKVAEPADDFQGFDLAVWLKGLAPGDVAASDRNPLLFP